MGIVDTYNYYMNDFADPRVNDFWLLKSPFPVIVILVNYLYFVKVCGPKYMKDKKPYDLKIFVKFYNLLQIFGNAYIVKKFMLEGWTSIGFPLGCTSIDRSYDPVAYMFARVFIVAFCFKLMDLIETVVMVLRKKQKQVSFLHVYHHVSMVVNAWLGVKYYPGGMAVVGTSLNNLVHVFMYSYYFLSSYPQITKYLAVVKPLITKVQMVQFVLLIIYFGMMLNPSCDGPKFLAAIFMFNVVIYFILFRNFYQKEYIEKSNAKYKTKAS